MRNNIQEATLSLVLEVPLLVKRFHIVSVLCLSVLCLLICLTLPIILQPFLPQQIFSSPKWLQLALLLAGMHLMFSLLDTGYVWIPKRKLDQWKSLPRHLVRLPLLLRVWWWVMAEYFLLKTLASMCWLCQCWLWICFLTLKTFCYSSNFNPNGI